MTEATDIALLAEFQTLRARARALETEHRRLNALAIRDTAQLAHLERAYTVVVRRRDFLAARLGVRAEE